MSARGRVSVLLPCPCTWYQNLTDNQQVQPVRTLIPFPRDNIVHSVISPHCRCIPPSLLLQLPYT